MASEIDIKKRTEFFLRDLHARERLRLGWYRQWPFSEESLRELRQRKSHHTAFLLDLMRKRGLKPVWYAGFFYLLGHLFGMTTALLPKRAAAQLEQWLENRMLFRYKRYYREMTLDAGLRSMVESVQLRRMSHNEPGPDTLRMIEHFIQDQERVLGPRAKQPV